jgi:hypothetical protein
VSESKRAKVLNTRTDTLHASNDVEIMWNILVAILQDDFALVEDNSGDPPAIDCAAVISDKIWMVLSEELEALGLLESIREMRFIPSSLSKA